MNKELLSIKEKQKERNIDIYKLSNIKVQKIFNFPTSSFCFFFISFGLFILSCQATGWCQYGSTFLNSIFLFLSLCQYIIGIYDWNQGNNLLIYYQHSFL